MAEKTNAAKQDSSQESYRLAKLIRQGNRELERQYNSKKTK
ncbi:MAG: hypothetical protein ACI4Q4_09615 [Oscillospiraceae bacterium]